MKIWKKDVRSSSPSTKIAGMVKTDPPTRMPEVAPMARTLTFSSRVERRASRAEKPIARIEIGIADSMPWPSLSAM
jgi:hypothetical protein